MVNVQFTDDEAECVVRALSNYIRDTRKYADELTARGGEPAATMLREVCDRLDTLANRIAETEDANNA